MSSFFRSSALLSFVFLLSACGNASLDNLRSTAPKGTPFQSQLAARYLQYAETASKDGFESRATYFADKGLQAAYGQDVSPEQPTGKEGDASADDMVAAHEKLTALLAAKTGDERPRNLADVQYYYDCWVDQTSLNGRDAGFCKDKFEETMNSLAPSQDVLDSELDDEEYLGLEEEATATKTEGEVHGKQLSYLVYFALNRAELNDAAKRTIEEILKEIKDKKQIDIVVSGHTDTSGDDKYNMSLSEKRAGVVKKALIALGVAKEKIRTFGYGETDPVIPTADDVVEPKNRRAEIVVN